MSKQAACNADARLIYERIADAVNRRDFDALDDIFDPQLINHGADPCEPRGAYHFKHTLRDFVAACPDLRVLIDDQVVEGDKVVIRWTDLGTHTGEPRHGGSRHRQADHAHRHRDTVDTPGTDRRALGRK
ncbi:MAG TPA: ester cyclase [Roseiflexaceae bacterium]|nr:ester cyclase [Roseiflexaceae bacterium]